MPRRGKPGTSSASSAAEFDVNISYELFSVDAALNQRTPVSNTYSLFAQDASGNVTVNKITNYTFTDAIENFKGDFDPDRVLFAFTPGSPDPAKVEVPTIPFLDLTARYLPDKTLLTLADGTPTIDGDFDANGDGILNDAKILNGDRIEYIFSGSELEDKGISEVALVVENVNTLTDVQGNLILDINKDGVIEEPERTKAIIKATSDIDSILNVISSASLRQSLSGSDLQIRVSGESAQNPDAIISLQDFSDKPPERIIIEAEDLNDLGGYKVVNIPAVGGKVISLPRSNSNSRTTTATATSGELNLGTLSDDGKYDVEISYFDENDGVGQLDILLNGDVKGTIVLNETTTSGFPNEDIRRSFIIQDLAISDGDRIGIRGTSNRGERARVDFISFTDSDNPLTSDSTIIANTTSEL